MSANIQDLVIWIEGKCVDEEGFRSFMRDCPSYGKFNSPRMLAFFYRVGMRAYHERLSVEMAKKQATVDTVGTDDIPVWSFIQCDLTEEEIAEALDIFQDTEVLWDMAVEIMKEGYKMSITYEEKSDSYCASLTGKSCPKPNMNKTITGWYDDPTTALAVVAYKHVRKLEGIWVEPAVAQKRRG